MRKLFKRLFKKQEPEFVIYKNGKPRKFKSLKKAVAFMKG